MNFLKKVIRAADFLVNCLFTLCFVPLVLYGVYALWDFAQINRQADQNVYETYRPGGSQVIF